MHIFDKETYFQGGWALVCEQLPYAAGAAKSILLDRELGVSDDDSFEKQDVAPPAGDDRIAVVFVGEGGAQNGRTAELLNAASKDNLPVLLLCRHVVILEISGCKLPEASMLDRFQALPTLKTNL